MSRNIRKAFLAAAVLPTVSFAQTNGTWAVDVGTAGGSWSVGSNWAGGMIADGGGTATFVALPFSTAPLLIVQDLPTVSLNQMDFLTQITYRIIAPAASPTNSITLGGNAALNTPIPSINTLSITTFGQLIQMPVTGSAGLVKRGPGTVTLWQNANTYTGGTRVEDGVLVLRQIGDAALGDSAGSVTFDGGTIRVTTTAWTSNRTVRLAAGGGTFEATTTGTTVFNGSVIGSGPLNKTGARGLTLTAVNSYNGPTNLLAGSIGLSGNGALTGTSALTARDALLIDNSATNSVNRINDSAAVTLYGAAVAFTGNATASSSETLGDTTFSRGTTTVTITPGTGQNAAIQTGAVTRDTGGTAFFRGTSLGDAPAPNTANLFFAAAPTLVGGGGAAGSTNISIIPWAFGNTSATAALNAVTSTFCTYGVGGVRPLNPATEFAPAMPSGVTTENVRLTASSAPGSPVTINTLTLAATTGINISGGSTLTITSGGILNLNNGNNISTPLEFGTAEAIIHAQGSLTLSGVISGTGGMSKHGAGVATFSAPNTYSGTTLITGGTTVFVGSIPSGAPSAFGSGTSAIVLAPAGVGTGGTTARLVHAAGGSVAFDRGLLVSGRVATNNSATLPGFGVNNAGTLVMNGDITLDDSPLSFLGNNASSFLVINGDISGSGPVTDGSATAGTIRLNGNNTFTDGVELGGGLVWQLGSNSAFGAGGLIKVVGTGTARVEAAGGARSIDNPIVCFSSSTNYWTVGGSENLTFTGSINLSGSYVHTISNTALTTYAGTLHTGAFTKTGAGTLVLSGDNIYTGSTTISAGALRATHPNALGSNLAPTIVAAGAALELAGGALTSEPVTLNGLGIGGGGGALRNLSGANSVGNVTVNSPTAISVLAGSLTTGNIDQAGIQRLTVVGGPTTANRVRVDEFALDGPLAIAPGRSNAKTSRISILSLTAAAQFDLGDNDLVVDYTGPSPAANVRLFLTTGYNGGAWTGNLLSSSAAASAPGTALGYAEASDIFTSFPATFSGQSVDNTTVLVRYTRYGDANLDGTVNIGDFALLAANFNLPGEWVAGDFNYDGSTNIADFALLAGNFNQSIPADAPARPANSAVPEPASAALLLAAAVMGRRRLRSK